MDPRRKCLVDTQESEPHASQLVGKKFCVKVLVFSLKSIGSI